MENLEHVYKSSHPQYNCKQTAIIILKNVKITYCIIHEACCQSCSIFTAWSISVLVYNFRQQSGTKSTHIHKASFDPKKSVPCLRLVCVHSYWLNGRGSGELSQSMAWGKKSEFLIPNTSVRLEEEESNSQTRPLYIGASSSVTSEIIQILYFCSLLCF